jgi:signal transduction histidine kinase/ligand-binding sensor domain-containing protein
MQKYFLTLVSLLLIHSHSFSQFNKTEFFKVGIEQGLTQANVYSIVQDNTGIIWLGTQDGLIRYTGTDYTEFLHNSNESGTISNTNISQILIHANKEMYISTWGGGLNKMDRLNDTFQDYYPNGTKNAPIKSKRIQCMLQEDEKSLWLGCAGTGVALFDVYSNTFNEHIINDTKLKQLNDKRIWALEKDNKGRLWIGTQDGLFVYNRSTDELKELRFASRVSVIENTRNVRSLYASSDHKMWVGTQIGLFIFNTDTYEFKQIFLNSSGKVNPRSNRVNCFLELRDHSMLIGTNGEGIYHLAISGTIIENYRNDPQEPSSLSSNDVRCLFIDASGLLWVGTRGGGVNTTQLRPQRFSSFTSDPGQSIVLDGENIRCLLPDNNGGVWVGTNNKGLNYIAPGLKDVSKISFRGAIRNTTTARILAMSQSPGEDLWLATDYGIHIVKKGSRIVEDVKFPADAQFPDYPTSIRSMLIPDNELLLVGTRGSGLYQFSQKTNTWTLYNAKTQGFGGEEIFDLKKYGNDIFIASNNGLTIFNLTTKTFTTYGLASDGKGHLNDTQIWTICISRTGMVWLGTSVGLVSFDRGTKKFEKYTVDNGLESNVIYGILEDQADNLWLSSTRGLSRFSEKTHSIKNFNEKDGLHWNVYNPVSCACIGKQFFAFGGVNGITLFDPKLIVDNAAIPTAYIYKFDVYEKGNILHAIPASYPVTKPITLEFSSSQNIYRIGFANTNYLFPGKNHFAYKMEGVDYNWQICESGQEASYSGLNPGEYTFRLKSANNDNIWSTQEVSIRIIIYPPFYATWWFRLLAAVLLSTGVFYYFRHRMKNMRTMHARLETLVAQRTAELEDSDQELRLANASKDRFFSIIAHDLRSPFQAIISFSNMLTTDYDILTEQERRSMSSKIESVSRSTYSMLENLLQWSYSQTKKLKCSPEQFDLGTTLKPVLSLGLQVAKLKDIHVEINLPETLPCFADMNMSATIFRNLISNAVKFTPDGGKIDISAEVKDKFISLSIRDTGIGMDQATIGNLFKVDRNVSKDGTKGEKGSGLGLILCYEFVKMNKGELFVESEPGKGAAFTVQLPFAPPNTNE